MSLRSLKIASRSAVCFGVMALLLTAVGLFGLWQMTNIRTESAVIQKVSIPNIKGADAIAFHIARIRTEALRLFVNPDALAQTSDRIAGIDTQVKTEIEAYDKRVSAGEEQQTIEALRKGYTAYYAGIMQIEKLLGQQQADAAKSFVNGELTVAGSHLNEMTIKLSELNQQIADKSWAHGDELYGEAKTITILSILLAVVLTILLAWRMTRSLSQPIDYALSISQTIAGGDLTRTIEVNGTDEPALLLQSMAKMQASLRSTLDQIGRSAEQLAASAEEMSSVMQESTQGLQQQNSEIEMAATAVTEMSQAVEEVANNANSTSNDSKEAVKTAENGQAQLTSTIGAISALAENVLGASNEAKALSEKTRNISKVLDVIRAVAEQTNLLALNAAIEAARAGEAGRGFAVVADEVRGLAHRTGESTREIESMVSSIQSGTEQTVDALLASAHQAQETQEQANSAKAALGRIHHAVSGIDERNMLIATASEEQAAVAREVDRNLVKIRDLSVQTAAGATQTHAASQELSRLAVGLTTIVRQFKF